jgi:hypothetical protein
VRLLEDIRPLHLLDIEVGQPNLDRIHALRPRRLPG